MPANFNRLLQRATTMKRFLKILSTLAVIPVLVGCTPKVQIAAPSEPVTINLNIKIEHEIRVKVEKDLEEIFTEDSGLF